LRILMTCALDIWSLSGQGGAPSLYRTLEAYGRAGHQIDFISPTIGANHHFGAPPIPAPPIEGVRYYAFHLPSIDESRLPVPDFGRQADQKLRFAVLFPILAARLAERALRGQEIDLLYGYEVHGVLAQRRIRRRRRLPLVTRFQGTIMHRYLGRPWQRLRRYEEVLALRTPADLVIMTDDGTQGDEVLARLNPSSAGKVRFWRNGLDLDNLRPPAADEAAQARRELGIDAADFVLVTATRLARWKRIDRAIDALALLKRQVPTARLIVVGDGEERAGLEAQAQRLGLAASVTFAGAVPQPDVQRYLWTADVFLSVNELSNVGNPLLEAMTAGRCILTIDEGDTRDVVRNGETGILLPAGEPAAIAAALKTLARDAELRRRLGGSARAFAEGNFWSWEERLEAEIDAVEGLVRDPAPSASARA
jgi:glycosyltransferase involved in cell wall biosynthesis